MNDLERKSLALPNQAIPLRVAALVYSSARMAVALVHDSLAGYFLPAIYIALSKSQDLLLSGALP